MTIANGAAPSATALLDGLEPVPEAALAGRRLKLIGSDAFAGADYHLEWLVKRLLVRGQPAVLGGPRKSLKTNMLVDLAVSLGTGVAAKPAAARPGRSRGSSLSSRPAPVRVPAKFLGHFEVARPVRVGVFSGESGAATLQETARRVCAAKNVKLADCGVSWGFELPRLSRPEDLDELQGLIVEKSLEVVILDPLYLSLVAGAEGPGADVSNLMHVGPLLAEAASACLGAGATPIFVHHARKYREAAERHEPLELEELAYAGIQEFARQWVLVSRRAPYDPETGRHELWLNVGGSAGFSSLHAVDVDEGLVRDDFGGRRWDVTVRGAGEARRAVVDARERRKRDEQAADEEKTWGAIVTHLTRPEYRAGDSLTGLAVAVGKGKADRLRPLVEKRLGAGELTAVTLHKGKRTVDGYRLALDSGQVS